MLYIFIYSIVLAVPEQPRELNESDGPDWRDIYLIHLCQSLCHLFNNLSPVFPIIPRTIGCQHLYWSERNWARKKERDVQTCGGEWKGGWKTSCPSVNINTQVRLRGRNVVTDPSSFIRLHSSSSLVSIRGRQRGWQSQASRRKFFFYFFIGSLTERLVRLTHKSHNSFLF